MILRELLGRSENGVSRFGSLQLGSITLQGFFHALRPSSMGPYSIEYVRLGQVRSSLSTLRRGVD